MIDLEQIQLREVEMKMKAIFILQRKHDQGHIGHCRVFKKWDLAKAVKCCRKMCRVIGDAHVHVLCGL